MTVYRVPPGDVVPADDRIRARRVTSSSGHAIVIFGVPPAEGPTISGYVFDAWIKYELGEDRPIPGASVVCGGIEVAAAPDGSFEVPVPVSIPGGDGGTVTVVARAPDHAETEKAVPDSPGGDPLAFWLWPISLYGAGRCTSQWP